MSDPADSVDAQREEVAGVTIEYEPVGGGEMRLVALHDDDLLARGQYASVFTGDHKGRTNRGEFLNSVEESLADKSGVDAGEVRTELRKWFDEMAELGREEELELMVPSEIRQIIKGTHYPVEIHGGETTTWKVELSFAGRTRELEFTAAEITGNSAKLLEEKIANQFFEVIEIEKEDWETIKERWIENTEVVNVVEETASDAIADRVLEKIGNTLKPVGDREDMGNDVAAAWYDPENATVYDEAPADAPIVWVQDSFLVDQLEAAGKNLVYKSQLIKDLIGRGDVYGSRARKKWGWDQRTKVYPFDPDAFGVTPDDVGGADDPNHSEVDA
jgi:hypothetical protein